MKYKIGDKVKIKEDAKMISTEIKKLIESLPNRVGTVKSIKPSIYGDKQVYILHESPIYNWHENWLEKVVEEKEEDLDHIESRFEILNFKEEEKMSEKKLTIKKKIVTTTTSEVTITYDDIIEAFDLPYGMTINFHNEASDYDNIEIGAEGSFLRCTLVENEIERDEIKPKTKKKVKKKSEASKSLKRRRKGING